MPSYRKTFCLTLAACMLAPTLVSWGQDDPARVLARQQAEGIDLSPGWRGVLVDWPFLDERGITVHHPEHEKVFQVVDRSNFEEAQNRVTRLAGRHGRLELLHGTPTFIPQETELSNLAVPVSLELQNVSTWEAIKAVVQQVNCARRFGDATRVNLFTAGYRDFPREFDTARSVSISVSGVPAREALAKILAQAPISLGITSRNVYRGDIREGAPKYWDVMIRFYRGNQVIVVTEPPQDEERSMFWHRELTEVKRPLPVCPEEPDLRAADTFPDPPPLIHLEWPFMRPDDALVPVPADVLALLELDPRAVPAAIERGQLPVRLTEVGEGFFVLQPVETPEGAYLQDYLAFLISVPLEGASVWEALTALCVALSSQQRTAVPTRAVPAYWEFGGGPPEFFEAGRVSLPERRMPARQVLREILAQSPVSVRYVFTLASRGLGRSNALDQAQLSLSFHEEGGKLLAPPAPSAADEAAWRTRRLEHLGRTGDAWHRTQHPDLDALIREDRRRHLEGIVQD